LAVAAALNVWYGMPQPTPAELAVSVGRARRSAIGTYGFAEGGLIVERGKLPGEAVAPLDCRLDLPETWRFVLLQLRMKPGLSGTAEQRAFGQLPPVPSKTTEQLGNELRRRLIPAAARGDFELFSRGLYEYGRLAGMCFSEVQGGPYNGPQLTELVDAIRSLGVIGVGQSSWGPTIFALLANESQAADFVQQIRRQPLTDGAKISITKVSNQGASIRANRG
jgi:beta-RFAP synthase